MPLGRCTVRNEYSLGAKELYKNGVEFEDPKVVLDGVAVAGLVGLLRQLGDLTQFAAEIFHSLQEQVASTVSRSGKLATRVQHVEASLPSLEKAILSQTSHIHFAYSPGSEWHPPIKNEQNHFICDDLPHFIMDSYEECHEPPRLQLLDRFDQRGSGSCLKRYSDPTFFRRASSSSETHNRDKSQRERKARKIKKRKPWQRSGQFSNGVPTMNNSERVQISSQTRQGEPSLSHSGSTFDRSFKSDLGDRSDSLGSKISIKTDKRKNEASSSTVDETMVDICQINYLNEQIAVVGKGVQGGFATNTTEHSRADVTWDEKLEIMEHMGLTYGIENAQHVSGTNYYQHGKDVTPVSAESIHHVNNLCENECITMSKEDQNYTELIMNPKLIEPTGFDYSHETGVKTFDCNIYQVEDLSEIRSCTESDSDGHRLRTTMDENFVESVGLSYLHVQEVKPKHVKSFNHVEDLPQRGSHSESNAEKDSGVDEVLGLDESKVDHNKHDSSQLYPEPLSQVTNFSESEDSPHDDDLVLANRDSFPQVTRLSEGDNPLQLETADTDKWAIGRIESEDVGISLTQVVELSKGENAPDSNAYKNFASDDHYMLETNLHCPKLEAWTINEECNGTVATSTEEVNSVNLLQWLHHDDIDSETDNFVDALNTIDSESESEYETQARRHVIASASICKLPGNVSTDLMVDKINQLELDHEFKCRENVETSKMSLANLKHLENVETSRQSEEVTSQELSVESPPSLSTVSQGVERCANPYEIGLEHVQASSLASHDNVSEEMPFGSTSSYPPALWTNGTLFGLQPLKPTVISKSNSARTSSDNGNTANQFKFEVDGPGRSKPSSAENYDHGHNLDSNCQDVGSLKHVSRDVSYKKYNKSLDHDERNINDDSAVPGLDNGHATFHESKFPTSADWKFVTSKGTTNTREDRSSLLSILGRSLLKNGPRRNGSLDYDDKNKPNEPLSTVSDLISRSNLNGKLQSPVNSPPPSPPLELMKISFLPIDGFETPRLKLKYPEGTNNHEITVESFLSFQLVPESNGLQHDMGSESDDDTFCRSYPCISDDSMSHLSDSDSEQWETGHTSESNNHAIYDGLRRISSKESSSSSSQHDEKDRQSTHDGSKSFKEVHSMSGPTSQSPILEMNGGLNPEADSSELRDITPQLPPLPPLQWRVSRPVLDGEVDKPEQGYDGLDHSSDAQLFVSAVSHPGPGDAEKLHTGMRVSDTVVKQTKDTSAKVYDRKQNCSVAVADGKTVDDRGEFLHQIRTKSFNLKRTDTGRSLYTPSVETSNKVTAILQKASAIRQAVGSDGDDDSSWSDT
ncbi:hypothetical protein RND81_06G102500 [Saponaria officinalis]|uniref:Protein SCAR n=2 Tax=Saponaria officinalis TaxID=3572 RepID=A0AAW1K9Q6_SAPOF